MSCVFAVMCGHGCLRAYQNRRRVGVKAEWTQEIELSASISNESTMVHIRTCPISSASPTTWTYAMSPGDGDASASSHVSRRESAAPSAWTHDSLHSDAASASSQAPLLVRGDTQASRFTASSTLREEMAGYQKRLEAHHRKESEDAAMREHGIGVGSSIPMDPPPQYSAAADM